MVRVIRAMRKREVKEGTTSSDCTRGLDHLKSPAILQRRQRNKSALIDAVLDEQDRQWEKGNARYDACSIALASSLRSRSPVDDAISLGASDAAEAAAAAMTGDKDEGDSVPVPALDGTLRTNDRSVAQRKRRRSGGAALKRDKLSSLRDALEKTVEDIR